mgnify:CR=1 FL=1
MQSEFNDYVALHKPHCFHVVGHSLGGAIAQLTALWASEKGIDTKFIPLVRQGLLLRDLFTKHLLISSIIVLRMVRTLYQQFRYGPLVILSVSTKQQ